MKRYAWYAALGFVGTGVLCTTTACTVTSGSGDDSGIVTLNDGGSGSGDTGTVDSAAPDTSSSPDTSTTVDTGASVDTGSSMDAVTDGAPVCEVPDGSDSCSTCLLQNCCTEETTCSKEPVDDSGQNECEAIASCFNDCIQPPADSGVEAGTPADCTTTCQAGHSAQGMTDFQALESCGGQHCSTQCQ